MHSNHGGETAGVEQILESTLESVDVAESAVLEIGKKSGLQEDDLHKLGMAVREAMVNAVAHGNRYSAHKKVYLRVQSGQNRLVIRIQDEGEGFEVSAVPDPLAQDNILRQSGRGLLLIRAFVNEVKIEPAQPRGTVLEMVKYLSQQ